MKSYTAQAADLQQGDPERKVVSAAMANKRKFTSPDEMQAKIDQYFDDCKGEMLTREDGTPILNKFGEPVWVGVKPLTVTGLALALGFTTRQALLNYQGRGEYKAIIEAAKLKIENYAEMRLYDKDGCNGARFNLQNNFRAWDADKPQDNGKKAPAINIICDIPKVVAPDAGSMESIDIDPQSVNDLLKGLGSKDGGSDG